MKTHFRAWPGEQVSACGSLVSPADSTDEPTRVTCRKCRRTHRYLTACDDDPPPMPEPEPKASELVRRALRQGPATARQVAAVAGVTPRRARQLMVGSGCVKRRWDFDRRVVLWSAPIGGW